MADRIVSYGLGLASLAMAVLSVLEWLPGAGK